MSYTDDLKPLPLTKQELNALMPRIPFNQQLGLRVSRVYSDGLALECEIRPEMTNYIGTLHGGVTAALMDVAVGMAVIGQRGGAPATTVELKLNYLRPVQEGRIRTRARLLKLGKTLAVGTAEVRDQQGRLLASGMATYMLL